MLKVGVVDYGMGNLHSVAKALALEGAEVAVTDQRPWLNQADLLVLPGVGSFGAAMVNLAKKNLDDFIRGWIEEKRPYLGICLGLQLLFERSEEDEGVPGLEVLEGSVARFRKRDFSKETFRTPHMGWNTCKVLNKKVSPYFSGIAPAAYYYFVHTYYPVPSEKSVIGTETVYGKTFCSAVIQGSVFATQFHPEKSGAVGLKLLSNIVRMTKEGL